MSVSHVRSWVLLSESGDQTMRARYPGDCRSCVQHALTGQLSFQAVDSRLEEPSGGSSEGWKGSFSLNNFELVYLKKHCGF